MILLQKIIIQHSDECNRLGLKHVGCSRSEVFTVNREFDGMEQVEAHRKQIKAETNINKVYFHYVEIT